MIALDSSHSTLTTLKPCYLFDFAMQLLNLPTNGTHLLGVIGRVLSGVVGHDIIRAVCRNHEPEQLQAMPTRKVFDVDVLTARFFFAAPFKTIHRLVLNDGAIALSTCRFACTGQ